MIDPRSQYIIYREQEARRMLQIERRLAAEERNQPAAPSQAWYSAAQEWLRFKAYMIRMAINPCTAEEEPC